jgi:hypothetical protein
LITNDGKMEEGFRNKERTALWTDNPVIVRIINQYFEDLWRTSRDLQNFYSQATILTKK